MFRVRFENRTLAEIDSFAKAGNKTVLVKINRLLEELEKAPFSGTGKPEPLKHALSGLWSRRINREHRLIYRVDEATVTVFSVKGHYEP